MSSSILNNLSEAEVALLVAKLNEVQQISGNEVSAKTESAKPINPKSGYFLVRLLNSKQYDSEAVVFLKSGEAARWPDGDQVTFGDLAHVENVRPDGTSGRHYPNVFALTHEVGSAAIDYLSGLPDKAKKPFQPKAGKQNSAQSAKPTSVDDDRLAKLEALVLALVQNKVEPAKPVPDSGVEKLPAKPEFTSLGDFVPGDVITVNGVAVQISEDGKRLNKTIVTK